MYSYISPEELVIDYSVRDLCKTPYPNHPKGCPNYGKRDTCPPKMKKIEDLFDISDGIWLVWVEFDFASHVNRMAQLHPNWSQRQKECCLYWQGGVNKKLREESKRILQEVSKKYTPVYKQPRLKISYCPEAMGINVTATMKNIQFDMDTWPPKQIKIALEWPPKNVVRKVAIIGVRKN